MAKLHLPIAIQGVHQTKLKSPGKLVKTFQAYLPDDSLRTYSCIHCRAQLASHDELISKSFQGSQGRAYLFNSVKIDVEMSDKIKDELVPNGHVAFAGVSLPKELCPFIYRVNVGTGTSEERVLITGLHAVADIYCDSCKTPLGWKYEHAFENSQKYKEGKYIIEVAHMIKDNGWS